MGRRDGLGRQMFAAAKELKATDAETFTLELSKPFGLVIDAIGKPSSNVPVMMPARLAATDPSKPIPEVIGSGPFVFDSKTWRPGDYAVFLKCKGYKPRNEPADGLADGKSFTSIGSNCSACRTARPGSQRSRRARLTMSSVHPLDFIEQFRKDGSITLNRHSIIR